MFDWLRPKCPIDVREKVWTEQSLESLVEHFGLEVVRGAEYVLPTAEFFPDPFAGREADIQVLLFRVGQYLRIDPERFALDFHDDQSPPNRHQEGPGGGHIIPIAESWQDDKELLIAVLAREMAVALLADHGLLTGDESHDRCLGELLSAILGLGVFAANSVVRSSSTRVLGWEWWNVTRNGYLQARVLGYALALLAILRNESRPDWAAYLGHDAASTFRAGYRYLVKTGDSLMRLDRSSPPQLSSSVTGLILNLESPSESVRLGAIGELARHAEESRQAVPALVGRLRDKNQIVGTEAAAALGYIGPDAVAATLPLLDDLRSPDSQRRAMCAWAIGRIGPPLDTTAPDGTSVLAELSMLLEDPDETVANAAVGALAEYGHRCEPVVARLVPAIVQSIVNCHWPRLDFLLTMFGTLTPEAERVLDQQLDQHDSEIRQHALQALQALRETEDEQPT